MKEARLFLEQLDRAGLKINTLKMPLRKKINKDLRKFNTGTKYRETSKTLTAPYFDGIPLNGIEEVLEKHGIVMIQEDFTKWSGMPTGRDSGTDFDLAFSHSKDKDSYKNGVIHNAVLAMSWHKMTSGRYEIVVYLT